MSGSVKSSDLPSAVASQIHERHNYQREDTQRSFGHSGPPSFLKYCQPPFPAGPQTQAQTYQTSHPQSSSGHGRPPSLVEHKQLPFPAVPQTPAQTYQTSHPQSSSHHDRPPSLLEHKTGSQTPVKKYKTSHPQSSSGCWASSMEYSRFPCTLAGQTHGGPSYQIWHYETEAAVGCRNRLMNLISSFSLFHSLGKTWKS
ncbi:uncharacterized protein LOC110052693 isoform X1 [Orbicella faveolata]|uniref:uncharacterized protein LOC110052693 isoform X1 n=1 Tax=Orbicella faveolata TaxID=48498 RepID=UPI0009E3E84D|nr:uncharacterized protein LOC110052693 isoform X1 [Orbicella faveolata]